MCDEAEGGCDGLAAVRREFPQSMSDNRATAKPVTDSAVGAAGSLSSETRMTEPIFCVLYGWMLSL